MLHRETIRHIFLGLLFFVNTSTYSLVAGSDTAVSNVGATTFPASSGSNRVANFGWMTSGFTLQNASTKLLFDSVFPVSGTIRLNGGTLTLNRDLMFNNVATLASLGTVIGQNRTFSLAPSITALPSNTNTFQDAKIFLNNDVTLANAITFTGSCTIEGNGYQLILGNNGGIRVGGSLQMHNVTINGVKGTNVQCLHDAATLILDTTKWIQIANSTFVFGTLQFKNDVLFTGTTTFAYQTLKTSIINSQATLMLDAGFTFSYDPTRLASKSLLQFADSTASLLLNGATLSTTVTGLDLKRGSVIVRGNSVLSSEIKTVGATVIDNGITFGDNLSSLNDCVCTILNGARLKVATGSLNYKNVASSSWVMENSISQLNMGDATTLRLYQSMNVGTGTVLCNDNVTIARTATAVLEGSTLSVGNLFFAQL